MSLRTPGHWIQTTFSRSPGQYFLNPAHAVCTFCGEIADWQQLFEDPLKWTTASEFRQHSDIPPGLLLHILNISLFFHLCLSFFFFFFSVSVSYISFSPSILPCSPFLISSISITRRRQRVYFQVLLHIKHSYTSSNFPQRVLSNDQVSVLPHWHHQKPLTLAVSWKTPLTLPVYLNQTHLGWSFCTSRMSGPSSTACKVHRWGISISSPQRQVDKGPDLHHGYQCLIATPIEGFHEELGEELDGQKLQSSDDQGLVPQQAYCCQVQESGWIPGTHPDSAPKECCGNLQGTRHISQASMSTPSLASPLLRGANL